MIGKVCKKYIVMVSARTKLGTVVQYLWTALVFGDWFPSVMEGHVLFNKILNPFYLWLYGITHMVRTIQIVIVETHCCNFMRYSFQLAATYAPSHRRDMVLSTSCGSLAGTKTSSVGPLWGFDSMTHHSMPIINITVNKNVFGMWLNKHYIVKYLTLNKHLITISCKP